MNIRSRSLSTYTTNTNTAYLPYRYPFQFHYPAIFDCRFSAFHAKVPTLEFVPGIRVCLTAPCLSEYIVENGIVVDSTFFSLVLENVALVPMLTI